MLVFSPLPDGAFPDSLDPARAWRLPSGLTLSTDATGPALHLLRFPGGGILRLRLEPELPQLAAGERGVDFVKGRFRLVLTSPNGDRFGAWRGIWPGTREVVDVCLGLDAAEAAIAAAIGRAGAELVLAEVELEYRGLVEPLPWLARVRPDRLRSALGGLAFPAPGAALEAAILGLDVGLFEWFPLVAGAPPLPTDAAMRELAARLLGPLFEEAGDGWRWRDVSETLDVSLRTPRERLEAYVIRWSFSAFHAGLADASAHFAEVPALVPFQTVVLHVVNTLPVADDAVIALTVDVDSGGPDGLVSCSFSPGQSAARLRFVQRTGAPARWRFVALVAGRAGAARVEGPWAPVDRLLLELTPALTGIHPLRVEVDPTVFEHADSLEVAAGARSLVLDRGTPGRWAMFRERPAEVGVVAVRGGARLPVGAVAVVGGSARIGPEHIGVGAEVSIEVRRKEDPDLVYLAVAEEEGPWHTLDPGDVLRWRRVRPSAFDPLRSFFRVRRVCRGPDGVTQPMIELGGLVGEGERIEVGGC